MSQIYSEETEKSFREILDRRDELIRYLRMDPEDKAEDVVAAYGIPTTVEDTEYIEHRIYHDYVGTVEHDIQDPQHEAGSFDKSWIPYEQDMSLYPEVFKIYQENYKKFEEVKNRFDNEKPFEEQGESPFTRKLPRDMSPWEKKYDDIMPKYTGTSCQ